MAKKAKKTANAKKAKFRKPKPGGESVYDRIRRKAANEKANRPSGGSDEFWKPTEPVTVVRPVLFTREDTGEQDLFIPEVKHWYPTDDGPNKPITCTGDDCPICAYKNKVDKDTWNDMRPTRRFLWNMVVVENSVRVMVVARLPVTAHDQLIELLSDEDSGDPLDPKRGHDFKIKRTGEKFKTRYDVVMVPKPSAVRCDSEPTDLYKYEPEAPSEEQVQAALEGYGLV